MSRTAEYRDVPFRTHHRDAVRVLREQWSRFVRRYGEVVPFLPDNSVCAVTRAVSVSDVDPSDLRKTPVNYERAKQLRRGLVAAAEVVEDIQRAS